MRWSLLRPRPNSATCLIALMASPPAFERAMILAFEGCGCSRKEEKLAVLNGWCMAPHDLAAAGRDERRDVFGSRLCLRNGAALPLRELSSADDVGLVGLLDIIAHRRVEQQEANVRIGPLDRDVSCGLGSKARHCAPRSLRPIPPAAAPLPPFSSEKAARTVQRARHRTPEAWRRRAAADCRPPGTCRACPGSTPLPRPARCRACRCAGTRCGRP